MYDCDLEGPECYQEVLRKARKPHKCGDCRGMIQIGEKYHNISGIWDGTPASYKRCADCQHIRCEIKRETGEENCMALNGLRPWLEDYGHRPPDSPWHRWAGMFNAIAKHRGAKYLIDTKPDPADLTPLPSPLPSPAP